MNLTGIDTKGVKFLLASGSPRRKEIFALLGLPFESLAADVDEAVEAPQSPQSFARQMAVSKASALARGRDHHCIIGADTVVALDQEILGKPGTRGRALETLLFLNGKTHRVMTGVAILIPGKGPVRTGTRITEVQFHRVRERQIREYVDGGEPLDKAGAYGIQGEGRFLIRSIRGCYHNVVGLPLCLVMEILRKFGVDGGADWKNLESECCAPPQAAGLV